MNEPNGRPVVHLGSRGDGDEGSAQVLCQSDLPPLSCHHGVGAEVES